MSGQGERTTAQKCALVIAQILARLIFIFAFGGRCFGRRNHPSEGGALICSNHQSHLDPVLVGLTTNRRVNYLARRTLFGFAPFRWLIEFFDAIPIDRDGMGLAGVKESLKRLRRGEMVLVFPEGTRSQNGEMSPLKPGFCSLARRGKVPILPIGFDGAFDAWPRSQMLPRPGSIYICVGEPISTDQVREMEDEELVAEVERRIRDCHLAARRSRLRVARGSRPARSELEVKCNRVVDERQNGRLDSLVLGVR